MKAAICRPALFLAAALAASTLAGCAEVRQDPASTTVSQQADPAHADPGAAQDAAVQSSTSRPF
jgi:hypothetical protein